MILAAVLAWLVPGAGHAYLGRTKRGLIIFVTIGATFWAGVAMGGVMTSDARYEPWWFSAESLTGIHGLVGWARQAKIYRQVDAEIGPPPSANTPDGRPGRYRMQVDLFLAKRKIDLVYPVGIAALAFAGVAGLLNLLCVFDAATLALLGVHGEPPKQTPADSTKGDPT